jgi:hypothetical protein
MSTKPINVGVSLNEHQSWCMTWSGEACTCQPQQEMASLRGLREKLDSLKQDISEVSQALAEMYKGPEILKMFMDLSAGQDRLWQDNAALHESQGKLLAAIDILTTKLAVGLKGVSDGTGQAIAELRKDYEINASLQDRRHVGIENQLWFLRKEKEPKFITGDLRQAAIDELATWAYLDGIPPGTFERYVQCVCTLARKAARPARKSPLPRKKK